MRLISAGMRCFFFIFIFVSTVSYSQTIQFSRVAIPPDKHGSRGVAIGDVNGDGFPEIVVANQLDTENPKPNPLYLNSGATDFIIDENALSEALYWSEGVSLIDTDNDRDLDIFLATQFHNPNVLLINDGKGKFSRLKTGDLSSDSTNSPGACWCDFDNDGDMDVYVVNRDGEDDNLYVNEGSNQFKRLREGPWIGNKGDGRACAWGDLNDDNQTDLYVVNFVVKENGEVIESHRNYLYLNQGNYKFQEVRNGILVEEKNASYGVALIDFDYDHDLDIYVTNVSTRQSNALYRNLGKGEFEKVTDIENGEYTNRPSKGQTWGDFNNDGFLDVYIANGTEGYPEIQNYLYLGTSEHRFVRINNVWPSIDNHISAGTASGDIDRDGDLDIYVCNWGGEAEQNDLYRNDTRNQNWIKLKLEGNKSNSQGIGSWVSIQTKHGVQTRYHSPQTGYGSQNASEVHFGLGDQSTVHSLEIIWPTGEMQRFYELESNREYQISEGQKIKQLKK